MSPLLAFIVGAIIAAFGCVFWIVREIRRRRKAERKQISNQQLADKNNELLETAPDGFFRWDVSAKKQDQFPQNIKTQCSRRLAVLLNLQNGTDSTFDDVLACFEEETATQLRRAVNELRDQGTPFELKLSLAADDKNSSRLNRQILVFGSRTGTKDDHALADVIWMRAETVTITSPAIENNVPDPKPTIEPKQTEQPVEQTVYETSETSFHDSTFKAALNSINTPLVIFNEDACLESFNDSYAAFWDLPADWLETKPTINQVLDALRERRLLPEVANFVTYKAEQRALFGRLTTPKEVLIHQPNGTTIKNTIYPTDQGGLVFSYEDVTDRLALERSVNALTAVQRETLNHLHEGIAVFGSDGRLKLCNPMFVSLWNIDPALSETEPHIDKIIELLHSGLVRTPFDPAEKERLIAQLLNREPDSKRLQRDDGKTLDYTKVPLPDGAILLSYLDVSDSARVEDALKQKAAALDEANKLKSAFIANVSDEVQTPLKAVLSFTDVLADEYYGELSPRQKEYIESIRNTTQGLSTIVTDILDLASIEAGLMDLKLDSIDVHAMMVSVLNLIQETARRKHLKLDFSCRPDIGWMAADEKRLKQILFNLLSNAIRFTPEHGTIVFKADRNTDEVIFTVSDTGPGIPQADHARIFQTFERATPENETEHDKDQSQPGAGLGLSLVKNFVELHGGTVDLKSRPGRGTTINCRFPNQAAQQILG